MFLIGGLGSILGYQSSNIKVLRIRYMRESFIKAKLQHWSNKIKHPKYFVVSLHKQKKVPTILQMAETFMKVYENE